MDMWEDEEIVEHLASLLKDPDIAITIMKTAKRVADSGNSVPVVAEGIDGNNVKVQCVNNVWTFKAGKQHEV